MTPPAPAYGGSTRPPAAALVAAVLAMLSAFAPGLFFLVAFAFSGGSPSGREWLVLLVPLALSLGLLVGACLLVMGRSWLFVTVPAALLGIAIIGGTLFGNWAEGALGFGLGTGLLPAAAAVLATRPSVRNWVAARRRSQPPR